MIWYGCGGFFGCILMVVFSVVSKNKWIGSWVSLILIGRWIYKGFLENEWIMFIDVVWLVGGYLMIDQLEFQKREE